MDIRWMVILFTIAAGLHAYFWKCFIRDTGFSARRVRTAAVALVLVTVLVPASFLLRRHLSQPLDTVLYLVLISWLAIVFFLVCLRFIAGVIPVSFRLAHFLKRRKDIDPSRRLFLSQALAVGTLSVGFGGLVHGVRKSYEDPEIREVEIKLDRLPPGAQGLTIAQLTDLHVAPWTQDDFVGHLVERTNALRPDIAVVTGDVVDGGVREIGPLVAALGKLRARYGVYFVTGNHEYYVGVHPWMKEMEKMGLIPLINRGVILAGSVYLAGIPDTSARWVPGAVRPDVSVAMSSRPEDLPAILLAHQPREIDSAVAGGVDLQLSGHTHGGQVWPFGMIVMSMQPYLSGLHRRGPTQIYVTRGAGSWGPPIRIGAPSEIARIVLV